MQTHLVRNGISKVFQILFVALCVKRSHTIRLTATGQKAALEPIY